jgi:hypothetical protein
MQVSERLVIVLWRCSVCAQQFAAQAHAARLGHLREEVRRGAQQDAGQPAVGEHLSARVAAGVSCCSHALQAKKFSEMAKDAAGEREEAAKADDGAKKAVKVK